MITVMPHFMSAQNYDGIIDLSLTMITIRHLANSE